MEDLLAKKSGIEENKINSLCLDIQNYSEKIRNSLNQMSDVMEELKKSFHGEISQEIFEKYEFLKLSYPTIEKNILSYIDEFNKVNHANVKLNEEVATKLVNDIQDDKENE